MIALLNVELELKAEKDNAEIRVHTVEVGPTSWQWPGNGQLSGPEPWSLWTSWAQLCFSGSLWTPFSSWPPEYVDVQVLGPLFFPLCSLSDLT